MDKTTLLHNALQEIDWDLVHNNFKNFDLLWYDDTTPTKKEIIEDVTELINVALDALDEDKNDNVQSQVVANHWIICAEKTEEDNEVLLEVLFTPTTSFVASSSESQKEAIQQEKLNERLKVALKNENYELAARIKKMLEKQDNG